MNDLHQLQADLMAAAHRGGEEAAAAAVHAGVAEADSAPRALLNVETVSTSFAGPDHATVTATQAAGVPRGGDMLPAASQLTETMAHAAAVAGARAIKGTS